MSFDIFLNFDGDCSAAISDGGEVDMPIEKTFFSEYYGMVTDEFKITWQLSYTKFE